MPTYPQLINSGAPTTLTYPQLVHRVIHSKFKVIHSLSTVNLDLHRSYPQLVHSLYTGIVVGSHIELTTVYTVKPIVSIVYTESPQGTVYTVTLSEITVYTVTHSVITVYTESDPL